MPGSVDSIPGKSNAEDHVSNSTWCGRKARTIVENAEQIVAGELLMAAQALSLVDPSREGLSARQGPRAAMEAIRAVIPPALDGDRWYATEMAQALDLVRSGAVVRPSRAPSGRSNRQAGGENFDRCPFCLLWITCACAPVDGQAAARERIHMPFHADTINEASSDDDRRGARYSRISRVSICMKPGFIPVGTKPLFMAYLSRCRQRALRGFRRRD